MRGGVLEQVDKSRGPLATLVNCPPGEQVQDDALFSILRPGSAVTADGRELLIRDRLGREVRLAPGGREPRGDG